MGGLLLCSLLPACTNTLDGLAVEHSAEPNVFGSLPAEKPLAQGKRYYREGHFGLPEQAFRQSVDLHKRKPEAWLGLEASYDQLRRFDEQRRANDVLLQLDDSPPIEQNNLAYD